MRYWPYLLFTAVFLALLHFSAQYLIGGDDVYRHIKYSSVLVHAGRIDRDMFQTPVLDTGPLFHLFLAPFALIPNLFIAEKISGIVIGCLIGLVLLKILQALRVRRLWLWYGLFFLGSADFLFRLLLVRTYLFSVLFLLIGLLFVIKRKPKSLFVTSVLYSLSYVGSFLLGGVTFIYSLFYSLKQGKLYYILFLTAVLGLAVGIIISPTFPFNVLNLVRDVLPVLVGIPSHDISLGQELQSYGLAHFLYINALVFIFWTWAIIVLIRQSLVEGYKPHPERDTLLVSSIIFFVACIMSQRFVEYWVPFAVLFSAVVISPYLKALKFSDVKQTWFKFWQFKVASVMVVAVMVSFAVINLHQVRGYIETTGGIEKYQPVAQWFQSTAPATANILSLQWDDYPRLYFWGVIQNVVLKIDPSAAYLSEPELYSTWFYLMNSESYGSTKNAAFKLQIRIHNELGVNYVLINKEQNQTAVANFRGLSITNSQWFQTVYEDSDFIVFEVK